MVGTMEGIMEVTMVDTMAGAITEVITGAIIHIGAIPSFYSGSRDTGMAVCRLALCVLFGMALCRVALLSIGSN